MVLVDMSKKWQEDPIFLFFANHYQKATINYIASFCECYPYEVEENMKFFKIPIKHKKPKYRDKEYLIEKYVNKKQSIEQIAKRCKCVESTIKTYLKKYNIENNEVKK